LAITKEAYLMVLVVKKPLVYLASPNRMGLEELTFPVVSVTLENGKMEK
jgi:hypothetical protein